MPEAIIRDIYEEARSVASLSSRSAAALLRLALQMLVDDLVPGPARLNDKIGTLVRQGLAERVQRAMDSVRVIGNDAVHPGQIEDADPALLNTLFALLNLCPAGHYRSEMIDSVFENLPAGPLDGIAKRDGKARQERSSGPPT